jgi:hypothetical protein
LSEINASYGSSIYSIYSSREVALRNYFRLQGNIQVVRCTLARAIAAFFLGLDSLSDFFVWNARLELQAQQQLRMRPWIRSQLAAD